MKEKLNIKDFKFCKQLAKCPVCGKKDIKFAFRSQKDASGLAGFSVFNCNFCGLYFINPLPDNKSLEKFYSEQIFSGKKELSAPAERYFNENERKIFIERRVAPLQCHINHGKILDYGCGVGVFVKILLDLGYDCDGIDLSEGSIAIGRKRLGLKSIKVGLDLKNIDKKYDAVLATTVIEHLTNPSSFLESAHNILKSNGLIVLEFPSADSLSFKILKDYWYWVSAPYHLYYYTKKSMEILLNKCGYKIIDINYLKQGWGWTDSIASSLKMTEKYKIWRKDNDFVNFTIRMEEILDHIAYLNKDSDKGKPSITQIYAKKI